MSTKITINEETGMAHIQFGNGAGVIMSSTDKAITSENVTQEGLYELRRYVRTANEFHGKAIKTWKDLAADNELKAKVEAMDFIPAHLCIKGGVQIPDGVYVKSDLSDLELPFAEFLSGKKFIDLGSGLGDVVEFASRHGADAYGAESSTALYEKSKVKEKIFNVDFFTIDLKKYDAVYYYLAGAKKENEIPAWLKSGFTGHAFFYDKFVDKEQKSNFYYNFDAQKLIREFNNGRVYLFPTTIKTKALNE